LEELSQLLLPEAEAVVAMKLVLLRAVVLEALEEEQVLMKIVLQAPGVLELQDKVIGAVMPFRVEETQGHIQALPVVEELVL